MRVASAACGCARGPTMGGRPVARPRRSAPPPPPTERGICNFGNTCYFGAVVQALASCPGMQRALAAPGASKLAQTLSHLGSRLRPVPTAAQGLRRAQEAALPWNVAARECLKEVTAARPEFRAGGRQQDMEELLGSCLSKWARA